MPGFDTGSVIYGLNVDFTGTSLTGGTPQVTTNGQLLIGSTSTPNIKVGTITSPDSSITIGYSSPNITLTASQAFHYYSLTPYIVGTDIHSQYTTVAAAIAAAVGAGVNTTNPANIYIKPKSGSYTENVTLVDGINLVGFGGQVIINGTVSMSTAGTASLNGLILQTNSAYCIEVTGSSASILNVNNCNISALNNTAIHHTTSNASSLINFSHCIGNIATTGISLFTAASTGTIGFNYCIFTNTGLSTTASTIASGIIGCDFTQFSSPITSSATGAISIMNSLVNTGSVNATCLTVGGSGGCVWRNGQFISGSASAISISTSMTAVFLDVDSSNTNTLTGVGTLTYGFIAFTGSSSGHNVTTETPLPTLI